MKIFISYAREDQEIAFQLAADLEAEGFQCWLDKKELRPGANWKLEIGKAIRESSFFVALLSSRSLRKRGFVQQEIVIALEELRNVPASDIFFIPVRIDECIPEHPAIEERQWVDLFPSYERGLAELVRLFAGGPPQPVDTSLRLGIPSEGGAWSVLPRRGRTDGFDRFFRTFFDMIADRPKGFYEKLRAEPGRYLSPLLFGSICIVLGAFLRDAGESALRRLYGEGELQILFSPPALNSFGLKAGFILSAQLVGLMLLTLGLWLALRLLRRRVDARDIATGILYAMAPNLLFSCFGVLMASLLIFGVESMKDIVLIVSKVGQVGLDFLGIGFYVVGSVAGACRLSASRVSLALGLAVVGVILGGLALGVGLAMLQQFLGPLR